MKLLTYDQLVDWLIYHCPLRNNISSENNPFYVEYRVGIPLLVTKFESYGDTPLVAYERLAEYISRYYAIHLEITELYWYWTI